MLKIGEIVLVPFPYSDRLAEKRRPALIVARPKVGGGPDVYWLAMITSAKRSAWEGDVPILDMARAGLTSACVVRSAKLVTLEHIRIVRTIGTATPEVLDRVRGRIRRELESTPA